MPIFLRDILVNPGFKYTFWMRMSAYLGQNKVFKYLLLYYCSAALLAHYRYKYGIDIPPATQIGSGLLLPHFGGIVVHYDSIIGDNCTISQGVTIGLAYRGERRGCPIIRNNVYIGPGAKIIGSIKIGNDVAVGANCVVTKDVPDNAVVAGVPGEIISDKGSEGYVANKFDQGVN